ncbi:hypothetical protein LINPERPRIM_LOCUS37699, partial [Linum perenne]
SFFSPKSDLPKDPDLWQSKKRRNNKSLTIGRPKLDLSPSSPSLANVTLDYGCRSYPRLWSPPLDLYEQRVKNGEMEEEEAAAAATNFFVIFNGFSVDRSENDTKV